MYSSINDEREMKCEEREEGEEKTPDCPVE